MGMKWEVWEVWELSNGRVDVGIEEEGWIGKEEEEVGEEVEGTALHQRGFLSTSPPSTHGDAHNHSFVSSYYPS